MLTLLGKPKIRHATNLRSRSAKPFGIVGNEAAGAASVTELILRKRPGKRFALRLGYIQWSPPVRLRAIHAIGREPANPVCVVHNVLRVSGSSGCRGCFGGRVHHEPDTPIPSDLNGSPIFVENDVPLVPGDVIQELSRLLGKLP